MPAHKFKFRAQHERGQFEFEARTLREAWAEAEKDYPRKLELEVFFKGWYAAARPLRLVYDESVRVSYGLWVCRTCGSEFYGGGGAMHNKGCASESKGYTDCEFHFNLAQVFDILERAAKAEDYDKALCDEYHNICLLDLQMEFPELLKLFQDKFEAEKPNPTGCGHPMRYYWLDPSGQGGCGFCALFPKKEVSA